MGEEERDGAGSTWWLEGEKEERGEGKESRSSPNPVEEEMARPRATGSFSRSSS